MQDPVYGGMMQTMDENVGRLLKKVEELGIDDRIVNWSASLVEIGPGRGAITDPLLRTGAELHAIEFDRDLAAELRLRYRDQDRFRLHEADALSFDFPSIGDDLRVVGNLPYNISSQILFRVLAYRPAFSRLVLMFQKEVGDRLLAVENTAARNGSFFVQEVDATAASLSEGELTAVETPPQVATRFPSRKRVDSQDVSRPRSF